MSSPTVRIASGQIHENFDEVSISKAINNMVLIFKRFYPFVISKELHLGNNDETTVMPQFVIIAPICNSCPNL